MSRHHQGSVYQDYGSADGIRGNYLWNEAEKNPLKLFGENIQIVKGLSNFGYKKGIEENAISISKKYVKPGMRIHISLHARIRMQNIRYFFKIRILLQLSLKISVVESEQQLLPSENRTGLHSGSGSGSSFGSGSNIKWNIKAKKS